MDNYEPWRINYKEFYGLVNNGEKLKFLLRFAILAPSSHNSQPWRFRIKGNCIVVCSDDNRTLPKSDENNRQLYISLGVALENLLTAAHYYGYRSEVRYFPPSIASATAVVALEDTRKLSPRDPELIKSIISRHTNRNKYLNKKLSADFLGRVRSLSSDAIKVDIVSGGGIKERIADIVSDALVEAMDDRDFRAELSEYIKHNRTKARTGMPMFGFGMPTILSYMAPFMLKRFNANRLSRKQDGALLKEHTPYFVIISSRADDRDSWIKTGRLFGGIALMAEMEGVSIAPMAAAIQIGDNYQKLMDAMAIDLRPQMFFRMGYAENLMPHSPRLGLDDVLEIE